MLRASVNLEKERDGVIYVIDVIEEVTLFHHHHHHNFVSLKGDQWNIHIVVLQYKG